MGSGKSTIGTELEQLFSITFKDLDIEIETEERMNTSEIFSKKGEIYFRKKERIVLESILEQKEDLILATGGGTPCFGDSMDFLNSKPDFITVYLKASIKTLTNRLYKDKKNRPLISHIDTIEKLEDFIRKHLFERSYYYNQAKIKVETDELSVEEIVLKIRENISI